MVKKFLLVAVLFFFCKANAQNGFTFGFHGTLNLPLGKFSEVQLPSQSPIAGEDLASGGFGFGGTIQYSFTFLSKSIAFRINSGFLELDDKQGESQVIDEYGNADTTDYKFRIIPVLIGIKYHPLSEISRFSPYAGFDLGAYFYSRVNTGPPHRVGRTTFNLNHDYLRFGLNFNLGTELFIYKHWNLDLNLNYNIVFLRDTDDVLFTGYTTTLQYFQIQAGILYSFNFFRL